MNFVVNLKTKFFQNPVSTNADKLRQTDRQTDGRTGSIYMRHFSVSFAEAPSEKRVKTHTGYHKLKIYKLVKTSGLFFLSIK